MPIRIDGIVLAGAMLVTAGAAPVLAGPLGAAPVDWSGFYAGVFAGYSLDKDPATSSSIGPVSETDVHNNGDVDVTTISEAVANSRISTVSGGGRVGYDYQDGALVLGTFASLNLGNFGKANSNNLSYSETRNGAPYGALGVNEQDNFSLSWYGSVEGKVGVAVDNWLFYAKGGVAFGDASASTNSSITASGAAIGSYPAGTTSSVGSTSQFLVGGTIGAGAAVKLTDKLSANLEYSFVDLPGLTGPASNLGSILGGSDESAGSTFGVQFHTIKAGIDYHF